MASVKGAICAIRIQVPPVSGRSTLRTNMVGARRTLNCHRPSFVTVVAPPDTALLGDGPSEHLRPTSDRLPVPLCPPKAQGARRDLPHRAVRCRLLGEHPICGEVA